MHLKEFTLNGARYTRRTYNQMHRTVKCLQHSSINWLVWRNGWVFVYELSGCGFESSSSHLFFKFCTYFEPEVPDIQATRDCESTLNRIRDMIRTYSQMHRRDMYSQHSPIILPVWLNGWIFVDKLSGCGFESSCNHLYFRFCTCFKQGVSWHSDNYRVWIHSELGTWQDKIIQFNAF